MRLLRIPEPFDHPDWLPSAAWTPHGNANIGMVTPTELGDAWTLRKGEKVARCILVTRPLG